MSEAVLTPTSAPKRERMTMRPAVVRDLAKPLAIEGVQKPVSGPGEIIVKIGGLRALSHGHPCRPWRLAREPRPPFTPGHEGVGLVESVGRRDLLVVVRELAAEAALAS